MKEKVFFEYKGKKYKYVYDGPGLEVRVYCCNCCFSNVSYGCGRPELINCIGGHWEEVKEKE